MEFFAFAIIFAAAVYAGCTALNFVIDGLVAKDIADIRERHAAAWGRGQIERTYRLRPPLHRGVG